VIEAYVDYFNKNKSVLREMFQKVLEQNEYIRYDRVVKILVKFLSNGNMAYSPYGDSRSYELDPGRITEIDHGEYQGTLIYVIGEPGYQPSNYVVTKVDYGSCSGCDTLDRILEDTDNQEQQLNDLLTLCLHIIQHMKLV
jgi:hypothetical protein